jgi:hypothetical protein
MEELDGEAATTTIGMESAHPLQLLPINCINRVIGAGCDCCFTSRIVWLLHSMKHYDLQTGITVPTKRLLATTAIS